jgi:23S rRNA (cytosine1962-C5)-methyltransferase
MIDSLPKLLDQALLRRRLFVERLKAEKTDAYRLFHGVAEGAPGLTLDRYGPLVLAQTFRDPLSAEEPSQLEGLLSERLSFPFQFVYNHRGKGESAHQPKPEALAEIQCHELGTKFLISARHRGIDPWLFLDLRVGRRFVREQAAGKSVLNLFSYTCAVGVSAAVAGASQVWNVDFAQSNLDVGERNARLNAVEASRFRTLQQDCLPVMRQLAGLPPGGRRNKTREVLKLEPRSFDLVFLDPPAWAKSAFGAVDVVNDYQSLFKSAVLIAKPNGGQVIATNHVASVTLEDWTGSLERCAAKAGRPLRSIRTLAPEEDFPSFDGRPPLKIAVCEV